MLRHYENQHHYLVPFSIHLMSIIIGIHSFLAPSLSATGWRIYTLFLTAHQLLPDYGDCGRILLVPVVVCKVTRASPRSRTVLRPSTRTLSLDVLLEFPS